MEIYMFQYVWGVFTPFRGALTYFSVSYIITKSFHAYLHCGIFWLGIAM